MFPAELQSVWVPPSAGIDGRMPVADLALAATSR